MAFPADRTNTRSRTETALLALVAALLAPSVHAQSRNADPELEALIPDSALAAPEDWVRQRPVPPPEPDAPDQPDDAAEIPWPDDEVPQQALPELTPDPDLAGELDEAPNAASAAYRGSGTLSEVADRVELVWLADMSNFAEREAFERRFRQFSALVQLAGKGEGGLAQLAVRARTDNLLLARLLRTYGYYDADVIQTVSGGADEAEGDGKVRFEIVPGVRYRFGAVDLVGIETAGTQAEALRKSFAITPGDPLSSDRIVAERGHLQTALGETGHVFARLGEPELAIDHRREEGDLTLPVEPGGTYRFGAITSSRPRFLSSRHLQDIARFAPGDSYKASEIDDLRRAIVATGLVSSVTVTPRETRAPQGQEPGEVALDIELAKAPLRTIAGAVGYDSGEGPRVEVSWEHRNLLPPEGMLRLRAVGGLNEQLAGVTFRRNNFKRRDQVLTFDLYADTVQRSAYHARTLAFAGTFERVTTLLFQKPWVWSAGLELSASNEREGAAGNFIPARQMYYTLALPLRAAFDGSDNLLDPGRGLRAALRISPEVSRQGGSYAKYARIQADASWYQPMGKGVTVALRTRLGSIPGAKIGDIAPSRRFYVGGGGSVRGFGYQQIGPRDTVGDPSGGRSLAEFSLETRFDTGLFDNSLALAPFIDAGAVDELTLPKFQDVRYGAGLGIRYKTGFGPIRVDLGVPLNRRKGESRFGVYVALGQAF